MRYTSADVGCHAGRELGGLGARSTLAWLLADCGNVVLRDRLERAAIEPGDETEALAILQQHTEPGLTWEFVDGDLMLTGESE